MTFRIQLAPLARILAKTAALVVALRLALFYFRLGWFLSLIWAAGGMLAVLLALPEIRAFRPRLLTAAFAVTAYVGGFAALDAALFDQHGDVTFEMRWDDRGSDNDFGRSEIVLEFVRFPGHAVGIYSNEVRDYLETSGAATVPVTFRVTRDLGCLRGFSERRIGSLEHWRAAFGYARTTGKPPATPWSPDPWWCP